MNKLAFFILFLLMLPLVTIGFFAGIIYVGLAGGWAGGREFVKHITENAAD